MLREGIEAALIVGIIASYLKQSGRGAWMPAVWTGILLALALSLFVGAGLWNHWQAIVFDLSNTVPADSMLGTVFAGVFGYNDTPTLSEAVAYIGFLAVSTVLFLTPARKPKSVFLATGT